MKQPQFIAASKLLSDVIGCVQHTRLEERRIALQLTLSSLAEETGLADRLRREGMLINYRKLTNDYRPPVLQQLMHGGNSQSTSLNFLQMLANLDSLKNEKF